MTVISKSVKPPYAILTPIKDVFIVKFRKIEEKHKDINPHYNPHYFMTTATETRTMIVEGYL